MRKGKSKRIFWKSMHCKENEQIKKENMGKSGKYEGLEAGVIQRYGTN